MHNLFRFIKDLCQEEGIREEDISAQQLKARPQTWVSLALVYKVGTSDHEAPPRQGPQAHFRLIGSESESPGLKTRSLTKQSEFSKMYREGYKIVGRSLVLYFLPAEDNARSVVASKKVGCAVRRNRAKRLLREVMGNYFDKEGTVSEVTRKVAISLNMSPYDGDRTLWVVAVARRAILEKNIHELIKEFSAMMSGLTT